MTDAERAWLEVKELAAVDLRAAVNKTVEMKLKYPPEDFGPYATPALVALYKAAQASLPPVPESDAHAKSAAVHQEILRHQHDDHTPADPLTASWFTGVQGCAVCKLLAARRKEAETELARRGGREDPAILLIKSLRASATP